MVRELKRCHDSLKASTGTIDQLKDNKGQCYQPLNTKHECKILMELMKEKIKLIFSKHNFISNNSTLCRDVFNYRDTVSCLR